MSPMTQQRHHRGRPQAWPPVAPRTADTTLISGINNVAGRTIRPRPRGAGRLIVRAQATLQLRDRIDCQQAISILVMGRQTRSGGWRLS